MLATACLVQIACGARNHPSVYESESLWAALLESGYALRQLPKSSKTQQNGVARSFDGAGTRAEM
jgi:hypothetical protein